VGVGVGHRILASGDLPATSERLRGRQPHLQVRHGGFLSKDGDPNPRT
jgi:hypothetical protein